ncbi:MAG TPA: hypothetical protein VGV18_03215 [Verrucomicrobiae bacterium]|nr:hypothetical protein [Verrucomicrobiae bacterium]
MRVFYFIVTLFTVVLSGYSQQIPAAAERSLKTWVFTNETVVANSRTVLLSVHSGSSHSRAEVQTLIGSQVAYCGYAALAAQAGGHPASLMLSSNVVLNVDIQPLKDVRPQAATWCAEVMGTLKRVDFQKRIIYIQAKPEDWRLMLAY